MTHPFSKQVGDFYDQTTAASRDMYDDNIHYGYWPDPAVDCTVAEAAEHMTGQLIARLEAGRGHRVLDVGCGIGTPALRLVRETGATVIGINVSREQVALANAGAGVEGLSEQARFECGDAMQLPYEDASFDRVWAVESMLHMPDRGQVLREMARVLRPGGRLVVSDIVLRGEVSDAEAADVVSKFCSYVLASSLEQLDSYPVLVADAGLRTVDIADVSAHTHRMGQEVLGKLRTSAGFFRERMGEQAFAEYVAVWEAMSALPQNGYAIVTADKPELAQPEREVLPC